MRRRSDREFSPRTQSSRDRSAYSDRRRSASPRKSHSSRYKTSKYPHSSRHSPRPKNVSDRRQRDSSPGISRTLCVRGFSSKLDSEAVQEYLLREFDKFGEFSINVGHLDGERAAILNFKYPEDAREAMCAKPSIHVHDRNVVVEMLSDSNDDIDTRKFSKAKCRRDELDNELEMQSDRRHISHPIPNKLEPNFSNFLNKSGLGPSGTASLLGMPGVASSAMMAAAARALGLNPVPTPIPPPPQLNITGTHNRLGSNVTSRSYDQNRNTYSPDADQDSKATRTLFVGSLEPDITESEVLEAFERYGYVEQVDIKRSPKPGVHSYAFVRYQNVDMACRAKLSISGRCIRSLHCKIGYGKPIISQCLYISGLESWMGPEALQRLLAPFGQLTHMDWSVGRKYALAMFDNCESAVEVCRKLKNLPISGRSNQKLRIDFVNPDIARPKTHATGEPESDVVTEDAIRNQPLISRTPSVGIRTGLGTNFGLSTMHSMDTLSVRQMDTTGTYSGRNFVSDKSMVDKGSFHNRQPHILGKTSYRIPDRRYVQSRNRHSDSQSLLSPVEHGPYNLQTAVYLKELDNCLQPDLWKGTFQLKTSLFPFRCLLVIGDANVGQQLGGSTEKDNESDSGVTLRIARRGKLDAVWMAEATHRVHKVLSTSDNGLCLMLVLPDSQQRGKNGQKEGESEEQKPVHDDSYPLHILIAYFKLKQAAGLVVPCSIQVAEDKPDKSGDESPLLVYLFAPSSFALSLLKQAAPQLSSDLATTSDYMVLLAIRQ